MRILSLLMVDNGRLKTFLLSQNWLEKMFGFHHVNHFLPATVDDSFHCAKRWVFWTKADKWRRLVLAIMETKTVLNLLSPNRIEVFLTPKGTKHVLWTFPQKHQAPPFSSFSRFFHRKFFLEFLSTLETIKNFYEILKTLLNYFDFLILWVSEKHTKFFIWFWI
jgi:hypothetical protein